MNLPHFTAFTEPTGDGWYVKFVEQRSWAVNYYDGLGIIRESPGLTLYSPLFATEAEAEACAAALDVSRWRGTVRKAVAETQDSSTRTPAL